MNGMKFLRAGTVVCMVVLGIMTCRADVASSIIHKFTKMTYGTDLTTSNENTVGTVNGSFVYTCSSGAAFGYSAGYVIQVPKNGVVETSIVYGLRELVVYNGSNSTNVKVYLSTNGSTYGDALTSVSSSAQALTATIPTGNYYVKIENKTNSAITITQIDYYRSDCNCMPYVAP